MPNAKNNLLALVGCLGWAVLLALTAGAVTGSLVAIARNPPILITAVLAIGLGAGACFLFAVAQAARGK